VLHELAAVTAAAARSQLRVELLEGAWTLAAQLGQRSSAKCRTDETVDQQPVAIASRLLDLMSG
jgi:hypothetical protein